ncbi:MAG TPA: valine--tRNA ligase [Candidatus Binataceae bacterium]|nr:valine--tRNA ligase [Candidatus Binataceae bacterium]
MELGKTFDPKSAQERWFDKWVELGYFKADPARGGKVFSIVIPPPNVTGQLHLGHALNVTLHDVIVRMRRMQGYNTLWLPGTDHAGIATQNVVERELAKEGLNRHQLGRDAFLQRVWQWRETYGGRILNQLRRLGASCDWSRERFTLDPGLSRAVTEVFVRLYRDGLIYRDRRLINWCPRCETALSDLEVDHKQSDGRLYYIRYRFADSSGSITVATTRPETMLGDTAVAVNPADPRYASMIGKQVRRPLLGREIPIIADQAVDREFGTGALKITPAHDPADFEIGRRHGLAQIAVMDEHARMNEQAGPYRGLTREEARKRVVEDLEREGLLEKIKPHPHAIGVCSRCETVVEPMLSPQWYVRIKPLADPAIAAVRDGRTTFHPRFWENTYFGWMENVHDWCISRQLWWGHRIPAYWCVNGENPEPIVAAIPPEKCPRCGGPLRQDEDVLDTWFSSGLWPFSTLGWPDETADLKTYYPTSLLITGFDIIFFWVARMMMLGLRFMDDVPFRDVYITPLVRDQFGKKMTKSRGNVVDPLEIIERYGTDAVRFTLTQLAVQGRDLVLSDDRLAASRAFANKIWNAARFAMLNLEGASQPLPPPKLDELRLAERWILDRLDGAIRDVTRAIDGYEFNVAALRIYQFIWHEFCDWYIELAKEPLKGGGEEQAATRWVLVRVFDGLLRLLHPFMPFISEEIWQVLRPYIDDADLAPHLAIARFPEPATKAQLSEAEAHAMERCIEVTGAINSMRSLLGFHPGAHGRALLKIVSGGDLDLESWKPYAMTLGKLDGLTILGEQNPPPGQVIFTQMAWGEAGIETPAEFNFQRTWAALEKKLQEISTHLERHVARMDSVDFQAKASPEARQETEEKVAELEAQKNRLKAQLNQLGQSA